MHVKVRSEERMTDRRRFIAVCVGLALTSGAAIAQPVPAAQPGAVRLRGTIEAASEGALDLSVRGGGKVHVLLPGTLRTTYVVAAKLSDIQPNSFIGTAAAPQPDGTLKALEVHVFPPSMRGTGEGFRPYDLEGGGSTMTNGTVGNLVGTSGRIATVKYGNEEKKVLIPDDVPVVSFEPTDRSALKAGTKVVVNGQRSADGTVTAAAVNVGKDGLTPPM
jgi:hypothetical protein